MGGAVAFGTAPDTVTYVGSREWQLETSPTTASLVTDQNQLINVREQRVRRGDSVESLLGNMGITEALVFDLLRNSPDSQKLFRQLAPGKLATSQVDGNGKLLALEFPLNGNTGARLVIRNDANQISAKEATPRFESRIHHQSVVINHSLFGATDSADIPDSVALQIAEIFGGSIDFHRDIRKGDRISVIYEMKTHLGRPEKLKRIIAAEFINDGTRHQAYWFKSSESSEGYYDANGNSLKKAFLRSPLAFSRITSGFSRARYHPVLKELRAHRGIDYGAPTGTPVRTTGDGIVESAGRSGGYGNMVTIRHPGGKTTVYAHLSKIAANLKKGSRVSQGETIGFVGATGLATGPHLHYEFRINGVHQNPQTIALPPADPLSTQQLAEYRQHAKDQATRLQLVSLTPTLLLD